MEPAMFCFAFNFSIEILQNDKVKESEMTQDYLGEPYMRPKRSQKKGPVKGTKKPEAEDNMKLEKGC